MSIWWVWYVKQEMLTSSDTVHAYFSYLTDIEHVNMVSVICRAGDAYIFKQLAPLFLLFTRHRRCQYCECDLSSRRCLHLHTPCNSISLIYPTENMLIWWVWYVKQEMLTSSETVHLYFSYLTDSEHVKMVSVICQAGNASFRYCATLFLLFNRHRTCNMVSVICQAGDAYIFIHRATLFLLFNRHRMCQYGECDMSSRRCLHLQKRRTSNSLI